MQFFPNAIRIDTPTGELYILEDFLNTGECEQLIKSLHAHRVRSEKTTPDREPSNSASRDNFQLGNSNSISKQLGPRIVRYFGLESSTKRDIQARFNFPGTSPNSIGNEPEDGAWHFLVFLNDSEDGGKTEFLPLNISLPAKAGQALFWRRLEGVQPKEHAPSAGINFSILVRLPDIAGTVATQYLHRSIPTYTKIGFEKAKIPQNIFALIQEFYQQNRHAEIKETSDAIGTYIKGTKASHPASVLFLPEHICHRMYDTLLPIFENWSGQKLQKTSVYGIRSYKKGANLRMHLDRYQTHIISAIINVDQTVSQKWPLYIQDHFGRVHRIYLKPGEMVFYESATVPHGRPMPLKGKNFSNIFIHTMPVGWEKQVKELDIALAAGKLENQTEFEFS